MLFNQTKVKVSKRRRRAPFFTLELQKSVNLSEPDFRLLAAIDFQGCDETIHTELLKSEQNF